jgi:hypothetical protein
VADDSTEAYAEGFDAEREELLGAGAVLVFLKSRVESGRLTSAWSVEFENDAALKSIVVARNDAEFNTLVNEASQFVVIGSDRLALNNQVFTLSDDAGRTAGEGFFWRLMMKSTGKQWFPPETP